MNDTPFSDVNNGCVLPFLQALISGAIGAALTCAAAGLVDYRAGSLRAFLEGQRVYNGFYA